MNAISLAGRARLTPNETTRLAQRDTVLSPRFYTTDFEELARVYLV